MSNLTYPALIKKVKDSLGDVSNTNKHLRPMISITFDDGYSEHYTYVKPLFESLGIRGTFFLISDEIGGRYMDAGQIKEMSDLGHEIGSHTVTHPSLVELTEEDLIYELKESKLDLQEITKQPVETLAYPFGHNDLTVRNLTGGFYKGARAYHARHSTAQSPYGGNLDEVNIYGEKAMYSIIGKSGDRMTVNNFKETIDDFLNLEEPAYFSFVFHQIYKDDDDSKPENRLSETEFSEMMQYLSEKKELGLVDVVTFSEALDRINTARSIHLSN